MNIDFNPSLNPSPEGEGFQFCAHTALMVRGPVAHGALMAHRGALMVRSWCANTVKYGKYGGQYGASAP